MSDVVTLTLRASLEERVELDGITADRLAPLSEGEIAALPIRIGRRPARLGDLFEVTGGGAARVVIEGDLRLADGLAAGTTAGEMLIRGTAGARLGARMSGGWVDVRGDAGDDAGLAMTGGALRIVGDVGDRAGAAGAGASKGMTGGELIVNGNAGRDAAARARRGLVVVTGTVGDDAARAIIAGTLVAFGRIGAHPGRGSKRGSVVALGGIDVPETYQFACTYQPVYLRLLLTYLRRRYGVNVEDDVLNGRFHRYCGDAGTVGRGEILALA